MFMQTLRRAPRLAASLSISFAALGCAASAPVAEAPAAGASPAEVSPALPVLAPDPAGSVASGTYRDLFVELGYPASAVDVKLRDAYERLFHGPAEEVVFFDAGENQNGKLAYVWDVGNDDVRSEGMSYGMMIALQMNQKQDFDALWNWTKSNMYVSRPDHPVSGYFSWQLTREGKAKDEMPAPDGEEYFATALLFAAQRWGKGEGIYDYQREALLVIENLVKRKPITGVVNGQRTTTGHSLFNTDTKMVRFSPDAGNFQSNGDFTDPSYHLPAFYEVWARSVPAADRAFWTEAAALSREHFVKVAHPKTGLTPDYSNFDGTPKAANWDQKTVNFRYDAWRTAMNWAVDNAWWAKDARQTELSNRLLSFFASQGENYPSVYALDGTPTTQDHSLGLVATNAVAALAASDPVAWRFVEALYEAQPPTGKWRYYNGMLYMMALLHVSGNFRVYLPAAG
jgi:oligosaccharide reducing-end xylanase